MISSDRWTFSGLLVSVAWLLVTRTFLWNPLSDQNGLWITVITAIMAVFYLGAALFVGLKTSVGFKATMYLSAASAPVWLALFVLLPNWAYAVAGGIQLSVLYSSYRGHQERQRKRIGKLSPLDLPVFG